MRLVAALLVLTAIGCSGGDGTDARGDTDSRPELAGIPEGMLPDRILDDLEIVPISNAGDVALFSDVVSIEPGDDVTYCTFGQVLDEPILFGQSFASQSPLGHHAIVQYTTEPREPGTTVKCGATEMDFQMLLGGTGGKEAADEVTIPDNVGVLMPAGAQLVINHHYINTTSEVREAQSMVVARRIEKNADTILAGTMNVVGIGWEIPARAPLTFTTECTYDEDVQYLMALGHMHEWGTHVSIDVTRGDGSVEKIIDQEWTEDAATGDAPAEYYPVDSPLEIFAGDTVRLTCNWNNTTDEDIAFPREMCIFFGYTFGQNYICGQGFWLTPEEAAAAAASSGF